MKSGEFLAPDRAWLFTWLSKYSTAKIMSYCKPNSSSPEDNTHELPKSLNGRLCAILLVCQIGHIAEVRSRKQASVVFLIGGSSGQYKAV